MLRIEKETKGNLEITTVGINVLPEGVKPATAIGALVGFLYGGIPGVFFGGLIGEAAHALSPAKESEKD